MINNFYIYRSTAELSLEVIILTWYFQVNLEWNITPRILKCDTTWICWPLKMIWLDKSICSQWWLVWNNSFCLRTIQWQSTVPIPVSKVIKVHIHHRNWFTYIVSSKQSYYEQKNRAFVPHFQHFHACNPARVLDASNRQACTFLSLIW